MIILDNGINVDKLSFKLMLNGIVVPRTLISLISMNIWYI